MPLDIQKSQSTELGSAAFPGELPPACSPGAAGAAFGSPSDTLCSALWSLSSSKSCDLAFENRAEAGGRMVLYKKITAAYEQVVADNAIWLDRGF